MEVSTPEWVVVLTALGPLLVAIPTAILAFFTWLVVKKTSDLGSDSVLSMRLSDVHHQESLTPLVVLDHHTVGVAWIGGEDQSPLRLTVTGRLRNVGHGPAITTKMEVQFHMSFSVGFDLGSLRAGHDEEITVTEDLRPYRQSAIPPYPMFTLRIRYLTVFGSSGTTTYENPGGSTKPIPSQQQIESPQAVKRPVPSADPDRSTEKS